MNQFVLIKYCSHYASQTFQSHPILPSPVVYELTRAKREGDMMAGAERRENGQCEMRWLGCECGALRGRGLGERVEDGEE